MSRPVRAGAGLALLALAAGPLVAVAQEWRASARVGQVTYDGAPAGASGSSSLVLGLGRTGARDWIGVSAAVPVDEDPFWAVLGGWKRLETRGSAGLLLDLAGHGFVQRASASIAPAPAPAPGPLPGPFRPPRPVERDLTGEGGGLELLAGGFAGGGSVRLESRAGIAAQRSRLGGVRQDRALPTGDLRLSLPLAPLTLTGETRAWLDDGVTHAWTGATLQYLGGPVQLWGSLGGWASGGREGAAWSAGIGAAIGAGLELQGGGRGNAFDPLYLSSTETSVWAGLSLRLGGARTVRAPVPTRTADGRAVLRLPARLARGTPSIAGDFNGWKPEPMHRDGGHWTWTARLEPGVYHYAFVAEDGSWFVPEGTPGRQDDGMGGHVAVVVVS